MHSNGQFHAQAALPPAKNSGTRWPRGWKGSKAGLDASNPNYPARDTLSIMTELHRSLIYSNLILRFMEHYSHKDYEINSQSFRRGYLQLYDKHFTETSFSCRVAYVFSLRR